MRSFFAVHARRALAVGLLSILVAAPAFAGEPADDDGAMPPMGRPAEMDQIESMLGEWTAEIKYRMAHDAPWETTTGHASVTAVLGGCAQRQAFSSNIAGMAFSGLEFTTFNRESGQFESVWFDDMGAKFTMLRGGFVDGAMILDGQDTYMGQLYTMRSKATFVSEDEIYWEMLRSEDGGETWVEDMSMVYRRVK